MGILEKQLVKPAADADLTRLELLSGAGEVVGGEERQAETRRECLDKDTKIVDAGEAAGRGWGGEELWRGESGAAMH